MEPKEQNRIMCPICRRRKLLFETEKKALNFIKYNGEAIQREGETLRAYYCDGCMGWHITSKPYKSSYENLTNNLIEAYHKSLEKKNKASGLTNGQ